ncbi:MAG: glycosyltransferase family 2 protein [Flavisolibacter sp.]|jgi:dolichol-phosphate mannosyltransferase|nr:glycosyltransferase family 2 protein [Flavisolibacter sp.]
MNKPTLSIIVPVYHEEQNIPLLHSRLLTAMKLISDDFEIIWVNDGSSDNSLFLIKELAAADKRNKYISFTRNFGHQMALMAGLEACSGKAAVMIDCDLQDPPELIPELWEQYEKGFKVVYARRRQRKGENIVRKFAIRLFYRLLHRTTRIRIPVDTGDFRLIDRKVIDALKSMPEQHKYLRGQIAWLGFSQIAVSYNRDGRFAGKSKYGWIRLFRLAMDGFTGFSNLPLKLASLGGFLVSLVAFIIILYALYSKFIMGNVISGWTSLIISTMFIGGIQLISIGIIGEYISRINSDVRKRPLYMVEEANLDL